MAILPTLTSPAELRGMSDEQLERLAQEIREAIITTVSTTGGHLGSSLGVVELTIALHRILESPRDRIVWDTGHQAYPHKLITGRFSAFGSLRQLGGIGGFPRRSESPHDVMDGGHAGTGLSVAQGLAAARDIRHGLERIAVVVGDAAMMSGLSLEALNDIGHRGTRMLIVLNDNEMSISPSVGALSRYLSTIKLSPTWRKTKATYDEAVSKIPVTGGLALELSKRLRSSVTNFAQDGRLFEDLGIQYIGVIPGHDLAELDHVLRAALELDGPVLVHVRTKKGRGYHPAEADQISFHGAALPPMARDENSDDGAAPAADAKTKKTPNYTAHFADEVIALAKDDRRICAITAGMPTGTGLDKFNAAYPERFFDVGIAEQHAVAFATGLALAGNRPVVALYSTFLQRAFDQVVHDVCQNDAPVLIGVDRAGLVGEDGTSHQGMFTLTAQRQLPNLVIASPKDEQELRSLVRTAFAQEHPFALHYPRDAGFGLPAVEPVVLPVGRGEVLRDGREILIIGFGPIVARGMAVAEELAAEGWSVGVINARFAKPLDKQLILDQARGTKLVVTLEESVVVGGFGSSVIDAIEEARLVDPGFRDLVVRIVGIPADRFVDHGSVVDLRRTVGLDVPGITSQVRAALEALHVTPASSGSVANA